MSVIIPNAIWKINSINIVDEKNSLIELNIVEMENA